MHTLVGLVEDKARNEGAKTPRIEGKKHPSQGQNPIESGGLGNPSLKNMRKFKHTKNKDIVLIE
jgi:hypothetical protein